MNERDSPVKPKVTFGIRVPTPVPWRHRSRSCKLRGKPNYSATILSGFTTT